MVCFKPKIAWKLNYNSLDVPVDVFEKQKKITFKRPQNTENYTEMKIPCGNCVGCKLDNANTWATRILLESKDHKTNSFITLTYDNEHLNINKNHMTLCKKDIQDFIKRLRFHKGKLSYFACGEYGGQTHRPHAHLIVFGYRPKDLKLQKISATENPMFTSEELSKIWGKGFVCVQDVNYKTACYTARYVQKKAGLIPQKKELTGEIELKEKIDERTGEIYTGIINKRKTSKIDKYGREKEFILMSKKPAIGLNYWLKNKDLIKRNGGILVKIDNKTQLKPVPRYFEKMWEKENIEELYSFKYLKQKNRELKNAEILEKISVDNDKHLCQELTSDEKERIYHSYLEKTLKDNAKLLKRNQI